MRFAIRTSPVIRPLLFLFGRRKNRDFLDLTPTRLRARYGAFFDETFALRSVVSAEPAKWPLHGGLGWRTDFRHTVGLIGTTEGVVCIRFAGPQRGRILFPLRFENLYVSLEDPEGFVEALHEALGERA